MLNAHILPALGQLKFEDINLWAVEDFQQLLKGKMCAARANKVMDLLNRILADAWEMGLIPSNPCKGIKSLRQKKPEINPMHQNEIENVLHNVPDRWRPFFTTWVYTGARPGELFGLKWEDLSFEEERIFIRRTRTKGQDGSPKTEKSARSLPMLPQVKQALQDLPRTSEYVFTNTRGEGMNYSLSDVWKKACVKADVEPRRAYEIRHSFASNALRKGVPVAVVTKMIGHANVSTTLRCYVKPLADDQEIDDAVRSMFA